MKIEPKLEITPAAFCKNKISAITAESNAGLLFQDIFISGTYDIKKDAVYMCAVATILLALGDYIPSYSLLQWWGHCCLLLFLLMVGSRVVFFFFSVLFC
mmetsp:Transcript_51683/g.75637  ORF Transcript_51683/g.75637 Transcript_51683/m.75637 type:complete len:100 (-) Transcript_51683:198-497(-)